MSDFLRMRGYRGCNEVACIGRAMLRAEEYGLEAAFKATDMKKNFTTLEIVKYIEDNYEDRIWPVTWMAKALNVRYGGFGISVGGVLLDQFSQAGDEGDVEMFYDQLMDRQVPCETVMILKKRLASNAASKASRMTNVTIAALVVKAWNAFMTGDDLSSLRYRQGGANPEPFPKVVTAADLA